MRRSLFALLLVFLPSPLLRSQSPTYSNLDYGGRGNTRQFLDLYLPSGLTRPAPLVVFIHGGGWQSGSKGGAMTWCDTLRARGYAVADINYRLSSDSVFPAQIHDCKAAVRWLKARAAQYFLDTSAVGVMGPSAGGHLAALVGTSGGVDSLEDWRLGDPHATSRVHAVADFYGPVDFLQMDPFVPPSCVNPQRHDDPNSPESRLLGCWISTCPARVRAANPLTYLDRFDPPFHILHGTADCTVPLRQSVLLDSMLRAAGVRDTLIQIAGAGHGGAQFTSVQRKLDVLAFFDRHLRRPVSVVRERGERPRSFRVVAYPNPFNPSTVLVADLEEQGAVRVEVYSLLGQMVLPPADHGVIGPGRYELPLDAGTLSGGMYMCKVRAGTRSAWLRLVLLR
jgi:acetyl esterase/lipase